MKDIKTEDAVVRNIEIIGEAAKNISAALKNKHKEIEWKGMAGMRDKIVHFYFGVNYDIVWQTSTEKLPSIKDKIEKLINLKNT